VGGLSIYGMPRTHKRSGSRRVLHWHLCVEQTQGRSQDGTVLSRGWLLKYPAFTSTKHLDRGDEISSLCISQTVLLSRLIHKLWRCG
jgi:hypothetical protein